MRRVAENADSAASKNIEDPSESRGQRVGGLCYRVAPKISKTPHSSSPLPIYRLKPKEKNTLWGAVSRRPKHSGAYSTPDPPNQNSARNVPVAPRGPEQRTAGLAHSRCPRADAWRAHARGNKRVNGSVVVPTCA